jgi:LPS sulfotransferase NodH
MGDVSEISTPSPWPHPCWLISQPRTGSTWLASLLNGAVGIDTEEAEHAFRETFHPKFFRPGDPMPAVTKCHIHWIEEHDHIELPPLTTRIILLTRDDHYAQTWSLIESSAAGKCNASTPDERAEYRAKADNARATRRDIETHQLAIRRWTRLGEMIFRGHPIERVTYEQLRADTPGTIERLMGFLGVTEWEQSDGSTLALH